MRNLTKTLAMVSLLAPSSGHSLGVGNIKLHSALNQNLDAEISLIVSNNDNTSDIKVNLAPPDKFDEAGILWTSFLPKIKFETVVGTDGSVIIKLSSREAVTEPFLDFLLEVNWSKGSLYREFTVLLDPPTAYKQMTIPVLTSSEGYKPEQAVIPRYQPIQEQQTSVESGRISEASEYISTHRNDTLRKIAEQPSRQAGVSVEQMMIALYEENPHAFYEKNVHSLLAGKTLKFPESENLLKFSKKQALAEYRRQTKAWKTRLVSVPIETALAKKDTPDNQLTLVAPSEAGVTENVIFTPENQQLTDKKKVDDAASKLVDKEVANITSSANDASQNKITELEKQMAMMQQMLALKDQQLAALQSQLLVKPVDQPEAVQSTISGKTGAIDPVTQQKPVQTDVKQGAQLDSETAASLTTYYLWVGGIGVGILSLLGWLWWRKRKLDEIINSQSLFASSSMDTSFESNDFPSMLAEKDSGKHVDKSNNGSFFSEFTIGDFDTFDADLGEIDPISEADVYLAYGRYQQAEELMRDAIRDWPGRDDCKLKLLEIFYSNDDTHSFETYVNELAKAGKKDDAEFWAKVTEIGSKICQDLTLFSSKEIEFSLNEATIFEKKTANLFESKNVEKNEVTDSFFDFDLNFFEDKVIDELQNIESIDFDLSIIATNTEESSEIIENVASKMLDIEVNDEFVSFDFDFGSNETELNGIDTSVVKESDIRATGKAYHLCTHKDNL
jgi:pilus assembly protein FimV